MAMWCVEHADCKHDVPLIVCVVYTCGPPYPHGWSALCVVAVCTRGQRQVARFANQVDQPLASLPDTIAVSLWHPTAVTNNASTVVIGETDGGQGDDVGCSLQWPVIEAMFTVMVVAYFVAPMCVHRAGPSRAMVWGTSWMTVVLAVQALLEFVRATHPSQCLLLWTLLSVASVTFAAASALEWTAQSESLLRTMRLH